MADVENSKGKFYAVRCDVSKEKDVKHAFDWIRNNLGTVQILINNAGIGVPGTFAGKIYFILFFELENFKELIILLDTDLSVGKSVLEINLFGTINCTKEVLVMMQESELPCHIVNINR